MKLILYERCLILLAFRNKLTLIDASVNILEVLRASKDTLKLIDFHFHIFGRQLHLLT